MLYPSLSFTIEKENDYFLPFLRMIIPLAYPRLLQCLLISGGTYHANVIGSSLHSLLWMDLAQGNIGTYGQRFCLVGVLWNTNNFFYYSMSEFIFGNITLSPCTLFVIILESLRKHEPQIYDIPFYKTCSRGILVPFWLHIYISLYLWNLILVKVLQYIESGNYYVDN